MKIKDIRASVLRFPVTAPLIERPIDTYEIVFCEVETDEGHLGSGLTGRFFPRGGLGPPPRLPAAGPLELNSEAVEEARVRD